MEFNDRDFELGKRLVCELRRLTGSENEEDHLVFLKNRYYLFPKSDFAIELLRAFALSLYVIAALVPCVLAACGFYLVADNGGSVAVGLLGGTLILPTILFFATRE